MKAKELSMKEIRIAREKKIKRGLQKLALQKEIDIIENEIRHKKHSK